jgi:outer membrane biosynthesis protein TonB
MASISLGLCAVASLTACASTVATRPAPAPACRADCVAEAAPAPVSPEPSPDPAASPVDADGQALAPLISARSTAGLGSALGTMPGPSASGGIGLGSGRPVPRLTLGRPTVGPALPSAVIRRIIHRRRPALRHCYERALATKPTLAGRVHIRFVIGSTGDVVSAAVTTGLDPAVDACVANLLRATKFPLPSGGGVLIVTYPFTFAPPPRP